VVVIRRKLFKFLPYTTVFFPADGAIEQIMGQVGAGHLARFFWTPAEYQVRGQVIRRQEAATVCVDLRDSLDELWRAIAKNARNEIRGAERLGDRIHIAQNEPQTASDFLSLYESLSRVKEGVTPIDRSVLQRYAEHADIFVAYLDQRPMCSHMYLRDATLARSRLLYSASRRLEDQPTSRVCGQLNRLLHWRVMSAYRDDGLETYDFGGIRLDPNNGIARFKTSFGGAISKEFTYLWAGSSSVGAVARCFLKNVMHRRSYDVAGAQDFVANHGPR
jgi:hypothetical protein